MPQRTTTKKREDDAAQERFENIDPQRIMSFIPLQPYHVVADVGCGKGSMAIPLAKYLFDGRVIALDDEQAMIDTTEAEMKSLRLTNMEFRLYEGEKLPLDDASLDGAFAAFVLNRTGDCKALLEEVSRALRPSAWLALLEWHKESTDEGPPAEQRIGEDDLRKIAQDAGFRYVGRHSLNNDQYMLVLRK